MWLSMSHNKSTSNKLQLLGCAGHDITYLLMALLDQFLVFELSLLVFLT